MTSNNYISSDSIWVKPPPRNPCVTNDIILCSPLQKENNEDKYFHLTSYRLSAPERNEEWVWQSRLTQRPVQWASDLLRHKRKAYWGR